MKYTEPESGALGRAELKASNKTDLKALFGLIATVRQPKEERK